LKITKVQATCHRFPLKLPLDKPIVESCVFVRVETDEGITGYGLTEGALRFSTRDFINRELAPFLVGKNPLETEKIWNKDVSAELGFMPQQFAASEMLRWGSSAVDIALWDIKGKYFKQPVFRLLGGSANRIPAYVTFGFFMYSREELAEAARQFVKIGQKNLKLQVSYTPGLDMAEEEARVRVVREAIGEDGMLFADGNGRMNLIQAREMARRIEPYRLTWFEGPVPMNTDFRHVLELKQHTNIPIAHAGSLPGRRWLYRDLIVAGAIDVVNPNVVHVGGYTEALKIANLAQAFSLPVATAGGQPHHMMHLIAGVANGWIVEFHYGHTLRDNIIFVNPPLFDHGFLTLPEKPGLGLEPNEAGLKEYLEKD